MPTELSFMANPMDICYVYTPLPDPSGCIRVLHLAPGLAGAEVNCRLEVVILESKPTYKALSYVWGAAEFSERIFIEGAVLRITRNLFIALQNLRDISDSQTFWIDAICINQMDIPERNAQVQIMPAVYSDALLVVVWLGEKDHNIDLAWDFLEKWYLGDPPKSITKAEFDGLEKIFQTAPWWRRLWVVQEIIFSQSAMMQCGDRKLPWNFVSKACSQIQNETTILERALILIMERAIRMMLGQDKRRRLHLMGYRERLDGLEHNIEIWATSGKCADKRDVIYVPLNLAPLRDDQPRITPDYNKSVSEVYLELTRHMLIFRGRLSTLCNTYHIFCDTDQYQLHPSWSIDWSKSRFAESLINYYPLPGNHPGKVQYRATAEITINAEVFHLTNPNILRLHAVFFDTMISVSGCFNTTSDSSWLSEVRSWRPKNLTSGIYPTGEDSTDAYIRTLFRDVCRSPGTTPMKRLPSSQLPKYRDLFSAWSTGSHDNAWNILQRILDHPIDSMSEFLIELWYATMRWCFFVTAKGYFGLVQLGAKVGDAVVVVDGAPTPLILRPASAEAREALAKDEEGQLWTRVSAAYVHGIMDGEVMAMVERGECVKEEVKLI